MNKLSSNNQPIGRVEHFCLTWKAKILLFIGQRERATDVFKTMLVRVPNDVHALNSLGYAWLQSGHPAQAMPYFAQVVQLTPQLSNAHFNHAFTCEALGMLVEAESGFRAAIAIEDKMDRAWYGLSLTLVRLGRMDEAVAALKRNTSLQPMSPFGWYQLARVHVELKQPEQALSVIQHLKGFEPKVAAQLERETGLKVRI